MLVMVAVHAALALSLLLGQRFVPTSVDDAAPMMVQIVAQSLQETVRAAEKVRPAPEVSKVQVTQPVAEPVPEQAVSVPQQAAVPTPVASSKNSSAEPLPTTTQPRFDAAYLNNPTPIYPNLSRRLKEQGTALLRVHVNADGSVAQIELSRSSGYGRLDQAAIEAVRLWRFVPARRGDLQMAAWVVVPIDFSLTG
ncbi:energy transducer TonB [Denitratisoma sp. DHT3]|uniref:energy transducer TonB n=1 Tax=Denitratisoma sp. DHT3 TaxID=1981880 RepID=UPI001C96C2F2|nr:energy transducer TonB [Denitratisoma sp. DHT3]